jgi:hypothetical protein
MREGYRIGRKVTSFFSSFLPGGLLRPRDSPVDLDYLRLERIRTRLERSDRGLAPSVHSGPDLSPGTFPGDAGRRADSILRRCLVTFRKDIDDIIRPLSPDDL